MNERIQEESKMRTAKVIVLPYDRAWKAAFEAIKSELESAVGDLVIGIEHVGSTSVEGLSAKPCIEELYRQCGLI